ncbi:MAG: hypothetical protein ABI977_18925 [Acidobacteriota bacterium]
MVKEAIAENGHLERFALNAGFKAIKTYMVKKDVEKQALLDFCNNEVKTWLAGQGVTQASFSLAETSDGLRQVIFALDSNTTEWGLIPHVTDFLETDGSARYLELGPQADLEIQKDERFPIGEPLAEIKTYLVKPGVTDDALLGFCNNQVSRWLHGQGVAVAKFSILKNQAGLKLVVFALDKSDTEWGFIPDVNEFLETDISPLYMEFGPQMSLTIPPPDQQP